MRFITKELCTNNEKGIKDRRFRTHPQRSFENHSKLTRVPGDRKHPKFLLAMVRERGGKRINIQ